MRERKTFIDFFAGCGGFRRGMELAGHRCIGFCEFDKFAVRSYVAMHLTTEEEKRDLLGLKDYKKGQKYIDSLKWEEREWFRNDIRTIIARDIPRADVWCFGFPCQDVSTAGKRLGFRGNRSSLFFAVTRLIRDTKEEDRPHTLLIENVKGLLNANRGFDFARVLVELDEIGYDAEWSVLNSADVVPQNRERIFIVASLRGRGSGEVFPIQGGDGEIIDLQGQQANTITARYGGGITNGTYVIEGKQSEARIKVAIPVLTPDREEKKQNGRRFKEDGEPMFTLTAQDKHGVAVDGIYLDASPKFNRGPLKDKSRTLKANKHDAGVMIREATRKGYAVAEEGDGINIGQPNSKTRRGRVGKGRVNTLTTQAEQGVLDGTRIRKLTPRECFRLQGWVDDYYDLAAAVNSESQLYKQAGNQVTVTVVQRIAEKL